jgi:hypothetical protein
MLKIGLFRNSRAKQHKREREYAAKMAIKQSKAEVPDFSYGAANLNLNTQNERKSIEQFIAQWFKKPEIFLDFSQYTSPSTSNHNGIYSFKSFLDPEDIANFFESKQPPWGKGSKIAFIILPHWNAYFQKYRLGTAVIRNFFLPVATYRYFPKLTTESEFKDQSRFDIVGPNIGLTIKRFWQDILNIQFFAEYLKKELDYDYVGIWAYSIGSPRGLLASMFSDNIDFLLMNFLAYSFPEAVLKGISTQDIAKEILEHLDSEELEELWSPLSPGKYVDYFNNLPENTRLVQPKYDLVFGEKNNREMVEIFKKEAPFVNIEYGDFGHITHGEIDKVLPTVRRNAKFVIDRSPLKFFKVN